MIALLKNNMYRLYTFFAATIFLILMGVLLFFLAGTLDLPAAWVYLGLRLGFTAASVLAMSEDVAKERLQPGPKYKPEPLYNIPPDSPGWHLLSWLPSISDASTGAPASRSGCRRLPRC